MAQRFDLVVLGTGAGASTVATNLAGAEILRAWLPALTGQPSRRHQLRGRSVHLMRWYSNFSTIARPQMFPKPTDITADLCQPAAHLLEGALQSGQAPFQPIGLPDEGISGMDVFSQHQRTLFDNGQRQEHSALNHAAARHRALHGHEAHKRGLADLTARATSPS